MNKINRFLTIILCFFIIHQLVQFTFAQELTQAKLSMQTYIESWFVQEDDPSWLLNINGKKIPDAGLEAGLKALDNSLKSSDLSRAEKEQLRMRYIHTYIDQSVILAQTYQDILENPDLDLLFQEFLRQAATQLWLENQSAKNPDAIKPSEDEINQYYKENSERLLRLGLSVSQIKNYTEQELKQAKLQNWTQQQLFEFKKQNPVEINSKLKKKYNLK